MLRRFWPAAVIAVGLGLIAAGKAIAPPPPPPPANVVFILIDTLRADRIGASRNNVPITPFLNEFATESQYFAHAVSPCSWTRPAMASLVTGLEVDSHRVYFSPEEIAPKTYSGGDTLDNSFETLAEYLKKHGYDTLGVQNNPNLTAAVGFGQGFSEGCYVYSNDGKADWVTETAKQHIATIQEPFLLYAHYLDPHAPYDPPSEYCDLFGPLPELEGSDRDVMETQSFWRVFWDYVYTATNIKPSLEHAPLSDQAKAYLEQRYDAEVRFTDEAVGLLVKYVQRRFPNTLFIITSDHGEEFWERGSMGHGVTLNEEQIHVPLWLAAPKIIPGRIEATVGTLGMLPTIAEYLQRPPNPVWQGRSWFHPQGDLPVYSRTKAPWPKFKVNAASVDEQADKLIYNLDSNTLSLYDLKQDPGERANISQQRNERASTLLKQLQNQINVRLSFGEGQTRALSVSTDQSSRKALEALGYLDSGSEPANKEQGTAASGEK